MKLEGTHAFRALEEIGSMKLNGLLHLSEIGWGGGARWNTENKDIDFGL